VPKVSTVLAANAANRARPDGRVERACMSRLPRQRGCHPGRRRRHVDESLDMVTFRVDPLRR
jgi:hypothetical protein